MTNSKHTPGPWHCTKKHARQISDGRGFKIAKCLISTKGTNFELPANQAEANARLIAAAPALMEALEGAVKDMEEIVRLAGIELIELNVDEWTEDYRALIARARGQSC